MISTFHNVGKQTLSFETNMLRDVQQRNIARDKYLSQCRETNIVKPCYVNNGAFYLGESMQENAVYFGKNSFYNVVRSLGGKWADSKDRPIVCLMKLSENDDICWAIPVGNWNHRDENGKNRIEKYLKYNENDIRSCYYHLGRVDVVTSIFFVSDIVPITDKYIEREYLGVYSKKIYIIKNKELLSELQRKVKRILAWENSNPNSFRQHITDIKNFLNQELQATQEAAVTNICEDI
ncbi:hypothetical protein [Lacrimispora sp.]|uniref:hypothetical protein n=1 Tax=Lacrimispora sp. TaxID=2719234 RepID=UPI00345F8727